MHQYWVYFLEGISTNCRHWLTSKIGLLRWRLNSGHFLDIWLRPNSWELFGHRRILKLVDELFNYPNNNGIFQIIYSLGVKSIWNISTIDYKLFSSGQIVAAYIRLWPNSETWYSVHPYSKMKVKHICVWPFVSLVVNIIQTRSLYVFLHLWGLGYWKCSNNLRFSNVWPQGHTHFSYNLAYLRLYLYACY